MFFNIKNRNCLTLLLLSLIILSELVQFYHCDNVFFKVLKLAKKAKKLKKWLPLLLMGPKILVIKTGSSQSTGYTDPCYSSASCCPSVPDYSNDISQQYSSNNNNYMSSGYPSNPYPSKSDNSGNSYKIRRK